MRKNSKMSLESKNKMSKSHKNKKLSDKTKIKLSQSLKNSIKFQEHLSKLHKLNIGRKHPHTKETKIKLSKINKGKRHTDKTKEIIHNIALNNDNYGMKNKHHTEKTKQHLSEIGKTKYGESASNWQGGISFEPYSYKFNKYLKEKIRNRDNRICQNCGKTEIENGKKLTVHHIDYNKQNCDESNLITLCISCNGKANKNRNYWKEYFMNKCIIIIDNYKNLSLYNDTST